MADLMTFPDTWEEYERSYGFTDKEEIYTNGARLIPSFRVEQWLEHIGERGKWIPEPNCMYRCSRCGKHYPDVRGYMTFRYCPNCGANMKEE